METNPGNPNSIQQGLESVDRARADAEQGTDRQGSLAAVPHRRGPIRGARSRRQATPRPFARPKPPGPFKILAEVEFTKDSEGVIVSQGSRFGGYTMFVKGLTPSQSLGGWFANRGRAHGYEWTHQPLTLLGNRPFSGRTPRERDLRGTD